MTAGRDERAPREVRALAFVGFGARLQYTILMALFRLAVSRSHYGRLARGLSWFFPKGTGVLLGIDGAPPFRVALDDGYWTRFALWHTRYEPEIAQPLKAAAPLVRVFCDLGANKGYWTVRAAPLFDRIIAVEAAANTFAALEVNAGQLANVTLHRAAIHSESRQQLTFVNVANSHASGRLLVGGDPPDTTDMIETVETRHIDDLVPAGRPALIKLDVEGAEVSALAGARRALRDGAVIIYEDHGADPACAPSRYLLADAKMRIFCFEEGLERLTSVDQIRALKTYPYNGYNLVAARADSPLLVGIAANLDALAKG